MSRISQLQIHNFKFFDQQPAIDLGSAGKHLLLYGENGSGKSSIYWALYTLLQCAVKTDVAEIEKYFLPAGESAESLVNIYAPAIPQAGGRSHHDSFIEVVTTNSPVQRFKVSLLDTAISGSPEAIEGSMASDFISYKVLYKFQDFWNGQAIDLAEIFEGYILPYITFAEGFLWREGRKRFVKNAFEMWEEIQQGPGTTKNLKGATIQFYKNSPENKQFEVFTAHFEEEFKKVIDFINITAPDILQKLGYDIGFQLNYHPHTHHKKDTRFECSRFNIELVITSYLGKQVHIPRPQSFLNEAKITAVALAIRFAVLKQRINTEAQDALRFIVLDDVMISLDMNNRDRLLEYLLAEENKFTKDYQLLFLTHDKNFFDFVANKIAKLHNAKEWVFKELYAGKQKSSEQEFPVLIDGGLSPFEKAEKYFQARDYTTSAIYIRKEIERLMYERLPPEFTQRPDGKFVSLHTLWEMTMERYEVLKNPVPAHVKELFKETKLLILNPQAHFQQLSPPVYRVELEKAFTLIDAIQASCPLPEYTVLLTKGMKLQFRHPTEDYTFDFELLRDFCVGALGPATSLMYPTCRVIKWQYNGVDFWDLIANKVRQPSQNIDHRLEQIKSTLTNMAYVPLNIDSEMFDANTKITDGLWTLKDLIDKAGISI